MIKIFISHKNEDSYTANKIANELKAIQIPYYLDVLDFSITGSGKALTDHIKRNLNDCTDILVVIFCRDNIIRHALVVISDKTKYSQWVPFEVGMSAQNNMPTATFLQENVPLPSFLEYWPRLKYPNDIIEYVNARKEVNREFMSQFHMDSAEKRRLEVERFYSTLKARLR